MRWALPIGGTVVLVLASLAIAYKLGNPAPPPASPAAARAAADTGPGVRPDPGPWPHLVCRETIYDFGTTSVGIKGTHAFIIHNDGPGKLKLKKGGASCQCTIGQISREAVKPGQDSVVTVTWKPKPTAAGPFHQTVEVLTNDARRGTVTFEIKGTVQPFLTVAPLTLDFGQVGDDSPVTIPLRVWSAVATDVRLTEHDVTLSDPKHFTVALKPLTAVQLRAMNQPAAKGFELKVQLRPGLAIGPFNEQMTLNVHATRPGDSRPANPEPVAVDLTGVVAGAITVIPPQFNLHAFTAHQPLVRTVQLLVRGQARTVFRVHSEPSFLNVTVRPAEIGGKDLPVKIYTVTLRIDPGTAVGAELNGAIDLETDHPKVPKVRIPVTGLVTQ